MQTDVVNPNVEMAESLRTVAVNSAYNASRALSKWFKHGVRLTCNGFEHVPITGLVETISDADAAVAAIHLPLTGDINGDILLVIPEKVALSLVDVLIGAPDGTSTQFTELEQSCLAETGNIVASAFANSLASWLNLDLTPMSPCFTHDLAAAAIEPVLVAQAAFSDDALVTKTEFEFDNRHLEWCLMLLPSAEALVTMREHCESDRVQRNGLTTIAVNGAFDASRAMSKWLRTGVRLNTDGFTRVPLHQACPKSDGDTPVVALHMALGDQMHGHMLMVLSMETAYELVDILMSAEPGTTTELNDIAASCLQETGNIVGSAFVNSWAKYLDLSTQPGAPRLRVDMPEAVFEAVLVEQAMAGDEVFMAKTEFNIGGRWLEWALYVLPTPSSLRLIEASCS